METRIQWKDNCEPGTAIEMLNSNEQKTMPIPETSVLLNENYIHKILMKANN